MLENLNRNIPKEASWSRELFNDEYAVRPGLILYHQGYLKNFFITDEMGERFLVKAMEDNRHNIEALLPVQEIKTDGRQVQTGNQLSNLNIELTTQCTRQCRYCYLGQQTMHTFLPDQILYTILDQADKLGVYHITLTGGEPTLDKRLLPLVTALIKQGISVNILTNGDLITPDFIHYLKAGMNDAAFTADREDCHICLAPLAAPDKKQILCPVCGAPRYPIIFQISLDSVDAVIHDQYRTTGSHEKALKAIRLLTANGFPVSISQTVTAVVAETDPAVYIDFAWRLQVSGIRIGILELSGTALQHSELIPKNTQLFQYYKLLLDKLDKMPAGDRSRVMVGEIASIRGALANLIPKKGCMYCKALHLYADGRLVVCPFCPDESFLLGDMRHTTLAQALRIKETRAVQLRSIADYVKGCTDCLFRTICGSGCRGNAVNASGNIEGIDPYCSFYKKFYGYVLTSLIRFPRSPRNLTMDRLADLTRGEQLA